MAASDRPAASLEALEARLAEGAHAWSFFQLVRALTATAPGAALPGGEGPARAENVRFRPALSLGFAPSGIAGVERLEDPEEGPAPRWRVTVNFLGIYGPSSPLPNHFTEDFFEAALDPDPARDFVDLFHHRIISLFHRAWAKYRYPVRFAAGGADDTSARWMCLMGLGTAGMERAAGLDRTRLLATAGLLADGHRSAAGLECFLRVQLGIESLRIEANVPRRARVPDAQQLRLARGPARLGRTSVLGERMSDRGGSFRVVIGPLDFAAYRRFLPGGADLQRMVRLTRLYVRDPLDFSVLLLLRAPEVPALRLGTAEERPLGWASWITPRGTDDGRARVPVRSLDPRNAGARGTAARPAGPRPEEPSTIPTTVPGAAVPRSAPRVTTIRRT